MLPKFPQFEPLSEHHCAHTESLNSLFPPYSDFNFTSLWSWDIDGCVQYSTLHGNLVVRFSDYLTRKPFYSFLGNQQVNETAEQLLAISRNEGLDPVLKLIPQETAAGLDEQTFHVSEDADNFDYILSVDQLRTFAGSRFEKHRNKVSKFKRTYQTETKILDLSDPAVQNDLVRLFLKWEEWKQLPQEETENERKAVSRLFSLATKDKLVGVGIFLSGELLGFTINELQSNGYGMLHFEKATPSTFTGIYQHLKQETARILSSHGCQLLNCQQDLGLPGLRAHKMGLAPVAFLRKYVVTRKE